jgi:uncharacterized membrane protein (UPF0182 family)
MKRHPARIFGPLVLGLLVLLIAARLLAGFYTEILWFNEVGYPNVFWKRITSGLTIRLMATALGGALVLANLWLVARRLGPVHVRRRYGNLEISEQIPRKHVLVGISLAALLTGLWLSDVKFGGSLSLGAMTFVERVNWGINDPLFGRDLSFYVFALPFFLQILDFLLLIVIWSGLLGVLGYSLVGAMRWRGNRLQIDDRPRIHLGVLLAAMLTLLGVRYWLSRYGVLFNGTGFQQGVGYTDIHARLPAQWALAALSLVAAASVVYGAIKRSWLAPFAAVTLMIVATVVLGYLFPSAIQKFRVEPNQLGREGPYIRWNIDYTRQAYAIDSIERRSFNYQRRVPASVAQLQNMPIWDPAPALEVLNQFQTGFGYYHFAEVDLDRYAVGSTLRPAGIAVREFLPTGLQESARTWQTLHLNPEYIRGHGAVLFAADQEDQNKPRYWLYNVPIDMGLEAPPHVALTEPSVYFGETMEEYGILGTESDTVQSRVSPRGIPLSSFLRVLAFASRFGEKNLLFSGQLTDSSRILIRRRLDDRLHALVPFIMWDRDPLPIVRNGRINWIIDGYSLTPNYPIARPLRVEPVGDTRYMKNSVKAVIDGLTGETTFYALSDNEPFLATYRKVFPGLFRPLSEMPVELQRHLRYPTFYLSRQADILEEYHLDRADAFYSAQDVWQLPRQRGGTAQTEPFDPVYNVFTLEPGGSPEFVLTAPFIANRRQTLTALLAVRNDPPNYGQMVLLQMPRDQQVPGPAQVEALIEQDPTLSPQLTLWRTAGSDVKLGNIRIIPVDSTLVYVLPLFLSASGNPVPELQRIIVSDGDRVAMAETLSAALSILRGSPEAVPTTTTTAAPSITPATLSGEWSQRALRLLDEAEQALRNGDWAGYGAKQRQLRELLQQATRR